ncbi:hypothetical protein GCM10008018_28440 [Paenibacillus marchantiophytorum]|uniref:Uncharacterized protein n=1 Tax=Paenibacillus marchantiophytorum TaxID=1619310 RepID=A0ABQ1EPX4_9BACL|nr:hypothetical protein GCM10008018_28440 [Paenibacillus marchantiophytorum]
MFINPYKNRTRASLYFEIPLTLGVIIYGIIALTGSSDFNISIYMLLLSTVFLIRSFDKKANLLSFSILLIGAIIIFLKS